MNKTPLDGLRVLNTRPREQAQALSQAIKAAGGIAIECPALAIQASDKAWLHSLPDLATMDIAIFISANAVHHYFNPFKQKQYSWPLSICVISVGRATARVLSKYGIKVDQLPPQASTSENLLMLPNLQEIQEKNILLVKGEEGRTLIAQTLRKRGAHLHILEVYKRTIPFHDPHTLCSLWQDDAVDIILFTSQQAMHNIFQLFGESAQPWLCKKPCLVISERLAKAASTLGMHTVIQTNPETILTTLQQFKQGLIHGQ